MADDDDSNSGKSNQSSKNNNEMNSSSNGDSGSVRSNSNSSTTGNSTTNSSNRSPAIPEHILATKEAKHVYYSRILVLSVLAISAAVAGFMTWWLSSSSEQSDFEVQFSDFALEIEDVSNHNANNVYLLTESYSLAITSSALTMGAVWPNVTVPHFEVRGDRFNLVTNAQLVSFCPIVTDLDGWNAYSVENQGWLQESYDLRGDTGTPAPIPTEVYRRLEDGTTVPEEGNDEYCPLWQESEAPKDTSVINFNLNSHEIFGRIFDLMRDIKAPVLSEVFHPSTLLGEGARLETADHEFHPESILTQPVFDDFSEATRKVVGVVIAVIPWDSYFNNLLHEGANGIICVLRDTCGDEFTYQIDGSHATYLGEGDLHNTEYDYMEHVVSFGPQVDFTYTDDDQEAAHCEYTLHIFPSVEMEEVYSTNQPAIFCVVVVLIFVFTTFVFVLYDYLVQKRQDKVHDAAIKSNAIVSSLFPAEIRDRLFQDNETPDQNLKGSNKKASGKGSGADAAAKFRLKTYLDNGEATRDDSPVMYESKPIADLFPNTTVMFADIAGFTAWSSVREPSQVFTLLETLYRAFDLIAKRRKVFKVETIGDCYVAVTGLPEPKKDHAVIMARFARDCMTKMNQLSHQLEVTLGPDTGDLAMRFGLHSGPVTAGVLRGDKSRFQLFGDTVNTAARIESTGLRHHIHISQETADLLKEAGKEQWVVPRGDVVVAKGKGEMTTFWLLTKEGTISADKSDGQHTTTKDRTKKGESTDDVKNSIPAQTEVSAKIARLVDWNVDVLKRLLTLIIAKRSAQHQETKHRMVENLMKTEDEILTKDGTALDEVVEIVTLPEFDAKTMRSQLDPQSVQIPAIVSKQLRDFVESLACLYRDNPFHNFEHASHVTMSVSKLLSRIVGPDIDHEDKNVASSLHDHTYGITSDPLTQFAVVISALIHDVDHVGVPNFVLINENETLAATYKNKSIAEQNSVDVAWQTLMEPRFSDLRSCIYADAAELRRFRQLVVQTVLATDIFDKELQTLRKSRWAKAFNDETRSSDEQEAVNRKATIVIEHLIQASDVAHTMQHWHIYQKWNERLFKEMYAAYKAGRGLKNNVPGWYQGELGFFDNYIIPLAKKLKDCGVFGVSGDEYLNYALENRREWAAKGEAVVAAMVEKFCDPEDGATKTDESTSTETKSDASRNDKPANASPDDKST